MPKYQISSWANYDIGDVTKAKTADLIKAVERAGKVANTRLRALEKAGYTGGMYAHAMADLGLPRKRFKEHAKTMSRAALQREYTAIRSFMSAATSTPSGVRRANKRRYETAKQRGYVGTEEAFYSAVERYFTKKAEAVFSSDVIYSAITEGKTDIVTAVLNEEQTKTPGEALLEYLKRK